MKYTEELKYIQEKISELRIKTELSRNNTQVKLIIKYKEFVNPDMINIFKIKCYF